MSEQKSDWAEIIVLQKPPVSFFFSGLIILFAALMIGLSCQKYGAPVLLGLEFTGGIQIEYRFKETHPDLTSTQIQKQILHPIDPILAEGAMSKISDAKVLLLSIKTKKNGELDQSLQEKINLALQKNYGEFEIASVDAISGIVGKELFSSGLIALLVVLVAILSYISYRFRRDFAICTIVALLHDVLVVVGVFACLGVSRQVEVNSLFLTACLTVLGFSVHDTIVVFDRVRENLQHLSKSNPLSKIITTSLRQVWFRSFSTSLTVLIALACLYLFGGESTKIFAGAMFIGMLTGSYSSLCVASPLLNWLNRPQSKNHASVNS